MRWSAGDMETAVEIVAANRHALIEMESYQRLAHWLNMFPPQIIESSPDLLLIQARFAQTFRFDVIELNQLVGKVDALLGRLHFEAQRAQHLSAENESLRGVVFSTLIQICRPRWLASRNALEIMPQQWYVFAKLSAGYTAP